MSNNNLRQQKQTSKVQIMIRIRPTLKGQLDDNFVQLLDVLQSHQPNTLQILRPGNNLFMKFNNIMPQKTTQKQLFKEIQNSIYSFLQGINNTIFAQYNFLTSGQTGAGKTYSIIGNYPQNISNMQINQIQSYLLKQDRGILPRSLQLIISQIIKRKQKDAKLILSFYQVYNQRVTYTNQIFDLFNSKTYSSPLDIRESKNGEVTITDLTFIEIQSLDEALQFLSTGLKVTFSDRIEQPAQHMQIQNHLDLIQYFRSSINELLKSKTNITFNNVQSNLQVVDLAGSQKFKISNNLSSTQRQIRIQELTSINSSLSSLGHCISALVQKSRTHIPFRNSKLTRVLSDCLIGKGKIKIIVCISPSLSASSQTLTTLQFANRAKKAVLQGRMLKPQSQKKKMVDQEEHLLLKQVYQKEKGMREQLQNLLNNNASYDLYLENQELKKEIQMMKQELIKKKQIKNMKQNQQKSSENKQLFKQDSDNYLKELKNSNLENLTIFKDNKLEKTVNQKTNKLNQFKEKMESFFNFDSYDYNDQSEYSDNIYQKINNISKTELLEEILKKGDWNEYSYEQSEEARSILGDKVFYETIESLFDTKEKNNKKFGIQFQAVQKAAKKFNLDFIANDLHNQFNKAIIGLQNLHHKDSILDMDKKQNQKNFHYNNK